MKTIKVKIAVAVNAEGEWGASGFVGADESDLPGFALDYLQTVSPEHVVWVTAEVPLPEVKTVEGTVAE